MYISFESVCKSFGNKKALKNINFDITRRSFNALIGNNGSGKTTLTKILCNLIKFEGDYYLDGKKITPEIHSFRAKVGIVLAKPFYVEELNLVDYWKFVCKFKGLKNKKKINVDERINELIEWLELEETNKAIADLSSGAQMKVSIGASLINNPEILVLDEPFIHLDQKTRDKIFLILNDLKGKKTIFLASHNLEICSQLCDHFLILNNGNIVQDFKKDDLKGISISNYLKENLLNNYSLRDFEWLN